ncbi:synaptotagmin-6, putative [Pediculus humanus corporis]|uniref:Synaptotagmin-6, putative n=1 Tax=Pediculus humanus subsp. corporis TaxID=121224 RepID=E0VXY2_PEDHC|nr:synaptotagmin-6, putative [Pediculus humanus corporis]EEB18238.1 synaptotagmin-6, putative [Pediculus humanus corporis]
MESIIKKRDVSGNGYYFQSSYVANEFQINKEQRIVQPTSTVVPHTVNPDLPRAPLELTHQAKSYPGRTTTKFTRTPSISSQGSLDSCISKQNCEHRGSSPQIRTFSPDGKSNNVPVGDGSGAAASGGNLRSTSPHRTASLDMRSSNWDVRTQSSSQGSLSSIVSSVSSAPTPSSPRHQGGINRCLSPLLIPTAVRTVTSESQMPPPCSPLGAIQPDLYTKKEGPLFLSGNGNGSSLGRLHLRLKYDFDRSDLIVHLIEAHDLAGSESGGFNDPYVRLELIPAIDNRKRQTTIHRNNNNPYFDEHFKFPVSFEDLQNKTLLFQIFDYDRFSRNDVIGEVKIPMMDIEVISSIEIWGEITKGKKPREEFQELLISLSYLPSAERLTVVVLKARNLFLPEDKEMIDPFVKVYLIAEGKRSKKKKTATRKGNRNPVWNEALTFNVSSSSLSKAAIEICVLDQGNDLIGHNPLLGCCLVGPGEIGTERDHWIEMMNSPRKAIAMWHTLR